MKPSSSATLSNIVVAALCFSLPSCGSSSSEPHAVEHSEVAPVIDLSEIVGINIGGDKNAPECEKTYHSTTGVSYASFPKNAPCWKYPLFGEKYKESMKNRNSFDKFPSPLENGTRLDFDLVYEEMPSGVYPNASVTIIDGKIEGIDLNTRASDQEQINKLLIQKYGAPTSSSIGTLQNRFGAKYSRIESNWVMPRMSVYFYGISSNPDEGYISAVSPKLIRWLNTEKSKTEKSF